MITRDEYQSWLDNDVTKRFLQIASEELEVCRDKQIFGTPDQIIEQVHERNAVMELLQTFLEWKPEELEEDEND